MRCTLDQQHIETSEYQVRGLHLLFAGHCLASAGDRGEILLWRPAPQADKAAQNGSPQPVTPTANRTAGADNNLAGADATAAEAGPVSWLSDGASVAWKVSAKLRGHQDDVNDMAWAHDDAVLLSGGVENECVLFHVEKRSFMVSTTDVLLVDHCV